jgi:hypothetical protein
LFLYDDEQQEVEAKVRTKAEVKVKAEEKHSLRSNSKFCDWRWI